MAQIELLVEPQVLTQTADRVSTLAGKLQSDFDSMQTLVSRTAYYWEGSVGSEYRREFASQKAETQEILTLLRDYPGDLLGMAGIYRETEKQTANSAEALPVNIIE